MARAKLHTLPKVKADPWANLKNEVGNILESETEYT